MSIRFSGIAESVYSFVSAGFLPCQLNQTWELEKQGDALLILDARAELTFEESIEYAFDSGPTWMKRVKGEELEPESRDLKFVLSARQKPLDEQLLLNDTWAHVNEHKIERIGGFLTNYIWSLYSEGDEEPFHIYDFASRVGRKGSVADANDRLFWVVNRRSYSTKVSDDSLATLALLVLRDLRFAAEADATAINREQRLILLKKANHLLNLTRQNRCPSNWTRLERIRKRSEIQEEITSLIAFHSRLPPPVNEEDEQLHKRITALVDRFSDQR